MTLVGCGLLWAIILLVILANFLPPQWWRPLGWGIGVLLVVFLGSQLLRYLLPGRAGAGGGPGRDGMKRIVAWAALLAAAPGCVATEERAADEPRCPSCAGPSAAGPATASASTASSTRSPGTGRRAPRLRRLLAEAQARSTATAARLLWDSNYLYFCAEMEDEDLYADVQASTTA